MTIGGRGMVRSMMVTGGAGFIGSNFAHYWKHNHPDDEFVIFDALTYSGNRKNLQGLESSEKFHFVEADICDFDTVLATLRKFEVDTIVHFAAESHVDRSIAGPDIFIQTNILGTHTLLKAAREYWLCDPNRRHRFHHVSTDEVYGSLGSGEPAFHESRQYEPNSPYSASKASSDHLVRAYSKTYGLQMTMSNCSNNYGPYQHPEKLIPQTVTNILLGMRIPVYGDGRNIRDWLYVDDHCRGIDFILDKGREGETYNIGGNSEKENIKLVKLLCDELQKRFESDSKLRARFLDCPAARGESNQGLITMVEDRLGHDKRYAINADKIFAELDFSPKYNFSKGIHHTIDWYLENENWWSDL